jgi:hypothetical protein
MKMFLAWATSPNRPLECTFFDCDFLINFFNKPVLTNVPDLDGLADSH